MINTFFLKSEEIAFEKLIISPMNKILKPKRVIK